MMDNFAIKQWLDELDRQQIYVYLQQDKLKLRTPLGQVPEAIMEKIKAHKTALITYLQGQQKQSTALSAAQQRMWFIDKYEGGTEAYNMAGLVKLSQPFLVTDIEQALNRLVAKHDILRARFTTVEGRVVQQIEPAEAMKITVMSVNEDALPNQLPESIKQAVRYQFDLASESLLQVTALVRNSHTACRWLLINMHHIISDGWSVTVFINALLRELTEEPLDSPVLQYGDYVHWEQQLRQSPDYQQQLAYWTEQLEAFTPFELPTSYPRKKEKQYQGGTVRCSFNAEQIQRLDKACHSDGVTHFSALLGVFYILLYRYSEQTDITLGVPVANRQQSEFETMLGCFINTLPLRMQINGEHSISEAIKALQGQVLQGLSNQNVAVEDIIEALELPKSAAHSALFQILFNYNGVASNKVSVNSQLEAELIALDNGTAKFDLTLSVDDTDDAFVCDFVYATGLYDHALIQQFADDYLALVQCYCAKETLPIDDLVLKSTSVSAKAADINHNISQPALVPQAIRDIAQIQGEAIAVVMPNTNGEASRTLTYQQLQDQSLQIANNLDAPASIIALITTGDMSDIVTMLGVMQSGRAYLPIDGNMPTARALQMLGQAECNTVVVSVETPLCQALHEADIQVIKYSELNQNKGAPQQTYSPSFDDSAYVLFTSGSTGVPKGVEISHGALSHYCSSIAARLSYNQDTRAGVVTGLATDLCLTAVYPVLTHGGTVVLTLASQAPEPAQIAAKLVAEQVNLIKLTPSFATVLLPQFTEQKPAISQWVLGGEVLGEQLVDSIRALTPAARIFNHYGPTEACVGVICHEVTDSKLTGHSYPIGTPLTHVATCVLNKQGKLTPAGMPGELYIGGPSLAKGYINAPLETAAQFTSSLQHSVQCARFYRSGDSVRLNASGELEFLGRIDKQAKIRGYRVDLNEIEAALVALDEVSQAAVVVRKLGKQDALVAFVVSIDGSQCAATNLREAIRQGLKRRLPEPMIPSWIELCQHLPTLSNGKIDRQQLQSLALTSQSQSSEVTSALQRQLIALYQTLTGAPEVGLHDSFFSIGGHSLLAMQLLNELRAQFSVEVSLKQVFANPSVFELSEMLANSQSQASLPSLQPAPSQPNYPLSFAQRRLWFVDQLQGHSNQYNLQGIFQLKGKLNAEALEQAFMTVIKQHPVLAFNYHQNAQGEPYQSVNLDARFALAKHDWTDKSAEQQAHALEQAIAEDYATSFDLSRDLMLRASLYQQQTTQATLVITLHHTAADGWSIACLSEALEQAYKAALSGDTPTLQEVHYVDYVMWQQQLEQSSLWQQELDYWRMQLQGLPKGHELPLDYRREATTSARGALVIEPIPAALVSALRAYQTRSGQTLFVLLQTLFSLWLSRFSQQRDVVVGTPVSGRHLKAFESMIGNFINTLVLRSTWSEDTCFTQALQQTQGLLNDALQHQHIPFDVLVDELDIERSSTQHPLHQIVFRVNNQVNENLTLEQLEVTPCQSKVRGAKLDLEVAVIDEGDVLSVEWLYDRNLWQEASVVSFHQQFCYVLSQCLAEPNVPLSALSLWPAEQQLALLKQQQSVAVEVTEQQPWVTQFSQAALQVPLQTAVRMGEFSCSYLTLEKCANQLANSLLEMAFAEQSRIAILLPSSSYMVAAVLAILKARHTYVPIHHDMPTDTLAYIMNDAGIVLTLALSEDAERLIEAGSDFLLLDDLFEAEGNFAFYDTSLLVDEDAAAFNEAELAYVIYTSGSTGQPKGVPISHGNLNNYLRFASQRYLPQSGGITKAVLSTPLAFDATVTALVPILMRGGELELLPTGAELLPALHEQIFAATEAKLFKLTPAHLRAVFALSDAQTYSNIAHRFVVGGEGLSAALVDKLMDKLPNAQWINEYGPTEATVGCSIYAVSLESRHLLAGHEEVPIGHAIDNMTLAVVDEFGQLALPNMPGELWLAGDGVCEGYINLASVTQTRFVEQAVPTSGTSSMRWYRSGDKAKWQANARGEADYLCYLGRLDEQVKLRGYRISLVAIAHQIDALTQVKSCAVSVDEAQESLVAHVVLHDEAKLTLVQLRQALSQSLPSYMLPAALDIVADIPLTANAKVDKQALQLAYQAQAKSHEVTEVIDGSKLTDIQRYLLELYRELLPSQVQSINDSFFDLGGHSLLAIKVISRVRSEQRRDITLPQLFDAPSIAAFAEAITTSSMIAHSNTIEPVSRAQALPLSFAQQRLWLIDQLHEQSVQYHMPASYWCEGALDIDALTQALSAIVARHEVLRTVIVPASGDHGAVQQVRDQVACPVELVDLSGLNNAEQQQRWQTLQQQSLSKHFDLCQDTMLRVICVQFSHNQFGLLFNMHHIASDGWSMALLAKEFVAFYRHFSETPAHSLPEQYAKPLAVQYADFAYWQQKQQDSYQADLAYWQTQLQQCPVVHELPLDFERPQVQSLDGECIRHTLTTSQVEAIKAHCQAQGVTLYMWLQSAFSLLMLRLSQTQDIVIGSPIAGREVKELEGLLGCFVNTLAIRTRKVGSPSFNDWLSEQKQVILAAFAHQSLPFEQLVDAINPPRSLAHSPVLQILFALQNNEQSDFELPHLKIEQQLDLKPAMKFDLEVNAQEFGSEIAVQWNYAKALFKHSSVQAMSDAFVTLIGAALKSPEQSVNTLPLVDSKTLSELGLTAQAQPQSPWFISDKIQHFAQHHANHNAVRDMTGKRLSFGELELQSNKLARYLVEQGVTAKSQVAISLAPSCEQVVALLAILKVGAVYVPLDPNAPSQRQHYILRDSKATCLITTSALLPNSTDLSCHVMLIDTEQDWQNMPVEALAPLSDIDAPAYMIYTSGTTGQPKGVMISHRNLHLYLEHVSRSYVKSDLHESVVSTPLAFDATVTSLWGALVNGLGVVLLSDGGQLITELSECLAREEALLFKLTPAHLQGVLARLQPSNAAHHIVVGGEALSSSVVAQVGALVPQAHFYNEYGPTEATVGCCVYRCSGQDAVALAQQSQRFVPIGNAIQGTDLVVLDQHQQPVPMGMPGELYIAGDNVAQAYFGLPELSASKFVSLSLMNNSQRYYQTGDQVRWLLDEQGCSCVLQFIGRRDNQVKLRGYRIELDEIAAQLEQLDVVQQAHVLLNESKDNLLACVVLTTSSHSDAICELEQALQTQVLTSLAEVLPSYMLPYKLYALAAMPLTNNGKVDAGALAQLVQSQQAQALTAPLAPMTELQTLLAEVFAQVLNTQVRDINSNFFELGGHSLSASQAVALIEQALEVPITLKVLFERPSVRALATWCEIHRAARAADENGQSEEMFL
ncbi:amino acid adenylation domain-containing protein [Pseudoalteromonas sp. McH1-7]|uniref:non-ribosomal peptide synthetase n=1 Tax=Pseudoalteromonas sp. McH1-7 TaxID=2745574 RepID=UPI0015904F92|nr:non-ribosomal peptide synthetase [Pseudoalteromonas sp. McH1-7]NUZ10465.1 amino acid adenylation domain-containing protein [Pseudoalteromonas sp. McH1-7]